jgi:hypothetical protein
MRAKTTLALAVIGGISIATLTGCAGEQSVADACGTAQTVVADLQADLATVSADATAGDFSKVTATFDKLEGKLDEAAGKVSNSEVKTALSNLSTSVSDFNGLFDGLEDGDIEGLSGKVEEFQTAATGVQDAGLKLDALCTQ